MRRLLMITRQVFMRLHLTITRQVFTAKALRGLLLQGLGGPSVPVSTRYSFVGPPTYR